MKVIGFHNSQYKFDDGRSTVGVTLYLGQDIQEDGGAGVRTERCFLSNTKLGGYIPCLGDEVIIERSASGSAKGVYCLKRAIK